MSIAAAHDALRAADEALAAAKVIRAQAFEELVAAVVADGWRVISRNKDPAGHKRIVLEHVNGRSMDLESIVAATLRESAIA